MADGFVKIDDSELRNLLRDAPKQVPFAMSKALRTVAGKSRDALRNNLRADGIRQNRKWPEYGIRVLPPFATRNNLASTVGSVDPIMAAASYGGDRPFPGLIPMVGAGLPRSAAGKAMAARWSRQLGDASAGVSFLERILNQKTDDEFGKRRFVIGQGVYERYKPVKRQRTREGGPTGKITYASKPIRRIFTIPTGPVKIRSRWKFQQRIDLTMDREWEKAVLDACDYALSTRKAGR